MSVIVFSMFIITGMAYLLSNREIFSPSFLFSVSFFFSSLWAFAYKKSWDLDPSLQTVLVITLGTLEFVLVASFTSFFARSIIKKNKINTRLVWINVSRIKLLMIIILEMITILYTVKVLKELTGLGSITAASYTYRKTVLFSTVTMSLPKLLVMLRRFSYACGLFFSYLWAKELVINKKVDWLMLFEISLTAYDSALTGSRTTILVLVIVMFSSFYILKRNDEGWHHKSNGKLFVFGGLGMIIFLSIFKQLATLMGRIINTSSMDYLAEYLGAEIKNLDIFIRTVNFPVTNSLFQSQTLINIMKPIGNIVGISGTDFRLILPFQTVNGFDLGNVYTTFYQFLYDYSYLGVFIFIMIMAIVSQISFDKAKFFNDHGKVSINILIYGYIASALIFSFFSNKFYEQIVSPNFIFYILFWIVLNFIFFNKTVKDSIKKIGE